jgi:V-type H+-transporting ATPase subunit E
MIRLLESEILVKCRKEDTALLEGLLKESETDFEEIMQRETNENHYKTKLVLLKGEHLTVEEGGECGGVILMSKDRRIVCVNTLQSRLNLCFEELLP